MSVRKIETRIPADLKPADLGEAIESKDGKCALVSFLTSPLPAGHENTYVLFVTDAALAGSIKSFEWVITEDGEFPFEQATQVGEITYRTSYVGNIGVSVRLLDAADNEVATLLLIQEIGPLNPAIETQIADAVDKPGAGAANPEVLRELVNDYYSYYQNVKLQAPEPDDSFKRFVCSLIFDGSLKNTHESRRENFTQLAAALDSNVDEFPTLAAQGVGVCDIRLALLAMNYPQATPLLPWTELPEAADKNSFADEQLRQKLSGLTEAGKIDLVNIARFPKTNISHGARIVENIRNKYFGGASFKDVMTGMNGTREHWIMKHYSTGPIAR